MLILLGLIVLLFLVLYFGYRMFYYDYVVKYDESEIENALYKLTYILAPIFIIMITFVMFLCAYIFAPTQNEIV